MSVRLAKPWRPLDAGSLASVPATVGVYEVADEHGVVADIGFAGGRSLFGLRGELARWLDDGKHWQFRCEVNSQYLSRYRELLMVHVADHGSLPDRVAERGEHPAGRLSPQGTAATPGSRQN